MQRNEADDHLARWAMGGRSKAEEIGDRGKMPAGSLSFFGMLEPKWQHALLSLMGVI